MEFKALIEQRRSVRAYRETAITREALETAARHILTLILRID